MFPIPCVCGPGQSPWALLLLLQKTQLVVGVCGSRERRHRLGGMDGAAVGARIPHEGSV